MTNTEFSDQFDVLYNSIASNQAPGLDDYEKSVFLTKAQEDIIRSYFNAKENKVHDGFDSTEKRQIDFSTIMKTASFNTFTPAVIDNRPNSRRVILPNDVMLILNEFIDVTREVNKHRLVVIPIDYLEYTRLMSKSYRRPSYNQAWRLIDNDSTSNVAELIVGANDIIFDYTIRYIKKPRAIILSPLSGVTIDGQTNSQTCELDLNLHQDILQRAVELAKASYSGTLQDQLVLGSNSGTNLGIVGGQS